MSDDYRVPVEALEVETLATDGSARHVTLFLPPGRDPEQLLEGSRWVIPAREGSQMRLFGRTGIMCVSFRPQPSAEEDDFPRKRVPLRVHLRSGATKEGRLEFVACEGMARPVDVLNLPSSTFVLQGDDVAHLIVKEHIDFVEELGR
jgi:hypothetical protein